MTRPADPAASAGHPEFDRLIRQCQTWLAERGETIVGSGRFQVGSFSGSLHSDFGPADQDKSVNQDYALVWCPRDPELQRRFQFVLAMADGLTASFRSEWASALACSVAVRALASGGVAAPPKELARVAFNEAGLTLGQIADQMARQPETSCPAGQFPSTWKYILRKGVLFETTLTLAWADRHRLRIAMLGDGGALCRSYEGPSHKPRPGDEVLAQCDPETHQVSALGPGDRCVREFDCWHERQLDGPLLCVLHTDGIGRGAAHEPAALLDELEGLEAAGVENPARQFIQEAVRTRPKDFDDNLTLAMIRYEELGVRS